MSLGSQVLKFIGLGVAFFLVNINSSLAQFSYFNQVNGVVDDYAESNSNIEVIGESFYICGTEYYQGTKWYFREYDFEGNLLNQKYYEFDNAFIWLGATTSFKKLEDESGFILAQEQWDATSHWSHIMMFDLNLDTLWTKNHSIDTGYSSYDTFQEVNEGFVLVGNYSTELVLGADQGTFMQKVDANGETIWSSVLNPIQEDITYRNKSIIEVDNKFIVGGLRDSTLGNDVLFRGYIEVVDQFGNTISVIESDDNGLSSQWYYILEMSNGDILCSNTVAYEESNDGSFFYKTKLHKLDMETNTLYWEHDYLSEYNYIGTPLVPKESLEGGIILMGNRTVEDLNKGFSSLLKIDENGQQEWYKEYAYLNCDNCVNHIVDFEVAPDGGYILAGFFLEDVGLPHYRQSWLLKLDACGDVVWADCDLVGHDDLDQKNEDLLAYPNPASHNLNLKGSLHGIVSLEIFDMKGTLVVWEKINSTDTSISLSGLQNGMYILVLNDKKGTSKKIKLAIHH